MKVHESKLEVSSLRQITKLLENQAHLSEKTFSAISTISSAIQVQTLALSNFVQAQERINKDALVDASALKKVCEEQMRTTTSMLDALSTLVDKELDKSKSIRALVNS